MNNTCCPLLHGSVSAGPFPGYVQGRLPQICKHACVPSLAVGAGESAEETLLREAQEYHALYSSDRATSAADAAVRWADIERAIAENGTYSHTFDELEHGARIAWRNAQLAGAVTPRRLCVGSRSLDAF